MAIGLVGQATRGQKQCARSLDALNWKLCIKLYIESLTIESYAPKAIERIGSIECIESIESIESIEGIESIESIRRSVCALAQWAGSVC